MNEYIVGIDEVGRGPVAGPVYVCAFLIESKNLEKLLSGTDLPVRDSKKLTEKMRDKWFEYLQEKTKKGIVKYVISKASSGEIDDKGIAVCIQACIDNCLGKLKLNKKETKVFLDGGLKTKYDLKQETIIKGDENVPVIALASIMAKVLRDTEMKELAYEYPDYGLERHKGYGTKAHMDAIGMIGLTDIHRKTFLKKFL